MNAAASFQPGRGQDAGKFVGEQAVFGVALAGHVVQGFLVAARAQDDGLAFGNFGRFQASAFTHGARAGFGKRVVAAGVDNQQRKARFFQRLLHDQQRHAFLAQLVFAARWDVGGQQHGVVIDLHAVSGKEKDDFIAFVQPFFQGVDGLKKCLA